ncbi:nitronate monooxygenase [Antricoccus suffuscus]|uniref:Nitronate monooxygenase n=1 Tax=Antricoccus suffuscus TaxID=1629062 RepID=A0A2T1A6M1_9ACTN|nr:nitronate monooxygenase [Antricoccus suffuscus]PRZ43978.1 nitronate monooxygenase [Antricoccus suffuscus]
MTLSNSPNPWPLASALPIIQAPMGPVSQPSLIAAVIGAGGLGMLAASELNPDRLPRTIEQVRRLSSGPAEALGCNFILDFDVAAGVEVAQDQGVRIISTFYGDPARIRPHIRHDVIHLHTVGDVADALAARDAGVDVLVAQGIEAGGHIRGTTPLNELVPAVREATGLPVVAAGGIATADDVRHAFELGACGVWVGTRFAASEESRAHQDYKDAIVAAKVGDTVYTTDCFDAGWVGAPHRTLSNSTTAMYESLGATSERNRDIIAHTASGVPIRRFDYTPPLIGMTGDLLALATYAGVSAERVRQVEPAAAIVADLATGVPTA